MAIFSHPLLVSLMSVKSWVKQLSCHCQQCEINDADKLARNIILYMNTSGRSFIQEHDDSSV